MIDNKVKSPLLSMSPMMGVEDGEDDPQHPTSDEAVKFTAETHAEQIKDIFLNIFETDLSEWAISQGADNAPVNTKTAKLLGLPHTGCVNHKLNLHVELMVNNHQDLKETLETVNRTMKACKTKHKIGAYLRNLTYLRPITMNKTRWSGKIIMLKRFIRMHSDLKLCLIGGEEVFEMDTSNGFKAKVQMYIKVLEKIDKVTVCLQKRNLSLSHQRKILNILIEKVVNANPGDALHNCGLGKAGIHMCCVRCCIMFENKNIINT